MKDLVKEVEIKNKLGLHARPAAKLVQVANRFSSDIMVKSGDDEVNAKSIMGILMLAAAQGSRLKIRVRGADAVSALGAIAQLVEDKFGEE